METEDTKIIDPKTFTKLFPKVKLHKLAQFVEEKKQERQQVRSPKRVAIRDPIENEDHGEEENEYPIIFKMNNVPIAKNNMLPKLMTNQLCYKHAPISVT
jgi:hypothetical protein